MASRILRLFSGPSVVEIFANGQKTRRRLRRLPLNKFKRAIQIASSTLLGALGLCAILVSFRTYGIPASRGALLICAVVGAGLGAIAGILAVVASESREI